MLISQNHKIMISITIIINFIKDIIIFIYLSSHKIENRDLKRYLLIILSWYSLIPTIGWFIFFIRQSFVDDGYLFIVLGLFYTIIEFSLNICLLSYLGTTFKDIEIDKNNPISRVLLGLVVIRYFILIVFGYFIYSNNRPRIIDQLKQENLIFESKYGKKY